MLLAGCLIDISLCVTVCLFGYEIETQAQNLCVNAVAPFISMSDGANEAPNNVQAVCTDGEQGEKQKKTKARELRGETTSPPHRRRKKSVLSIRDAGNLNRTLSQSLTVTITLTLSGTLDLFNHPLPSPLIMSHE
jgi:hypothetical protein